MFVAGKNNHSDFDKIYTLQEMAEFPLILLERKASSRVFLEQEFLKAGVTLTPEIELSSRQLLVTLAGIGLGVAGVTLEGPGKRRHPSAENGLHDPGAQRGYVYLEGSTPHGRGYRLYGNGAEGHVRHGDLSLSV